MRCLFCKSETSPNEPIEHILPESIGNKEHLLRRGVVCGKCNNYFASKVEKPFLEDSAIVAMRFHQEVPNKKGRVPVLNGVLLPANIVVEVRRNPITKESVVHIPEGEWANIQSEREMQLVLLGENLPQDMSVISRFIAKVALEALAAKLESREDWLDELVSKEELDAIREHARFGRCPDWPVSVRRIYPSSSRWSDSEIGEYQLMNEFDFLYTEGMELYFVLAIFGQEFVINMGGPELDGWHQWLEQHNDASPLHHGKNSGINQKIE